MRTRQREKMTDFHAEALFRFLAGDGNRTNGSAEEEKFAQAGSSLYEWWIRLTKRSC